MTAVGEHPAAAAPAELGVASPLARAGNLSGWRPSRAAGFAFLMGLVLTAALALASLALYNRNERRLLNLRVKELNLVVKADAQGTLEAVLNAPNFVDFSNRLESSAHNLVHVWTGGTMAQVPIAGFDPIFWAHHTMIDRLWSLWQLRHPGLAPDPALGTELTSSRRKRRNAGARPYARRTAS